MRYNIDPPPPLVAAEPDAVGAYEAKTHLPRLLEQVEAGASFVITRHGRPVARLVPIHASPGVADVVQRMLQARRGRTLGTDVRELIDEGRA